MISLADLQPLKLTNLLSSTTGVFIQKDISVAKSMPVWLKTTLRDDVNFRRLTSLIGLNYLHQLWNCVLNIVTLTCKVQAHKLICKSIFFTNILRRQLKYNWVNICNRVLVHRVNKLHATDSSIPPGLINKGRSIYISVPWFRFTLMDLSFRVLFHQFQMIFDRIRVTFSDAIWTKATNAIKYSPGITAVSGDRAHEHIRNKQAPREPKQTFK